MDKYENIGVLLGKTLTKIIPIEDYEIYFYCEDGTHYKMFHEQNCCENVTIEDISGNLEDLVGSPITMAEVVTNNEDQPLDKWDDSYTWTYYKFSTLKGYVTIRWYGVSNGFYSEDVNFVLLENK